MSPLHSQPPPRLDRPDRREIRDYFANTWDLYEVLFAAISERPALYRKPDPLRQPLIFYLGHTAVFYLNKFQLAGILDEGLNDHFEQLFAVGVDPARPEALQAEDWPQEAEVVDYRRRVRDLVLEVIDRADLDEPITAASPLWSLMMGLEHDRIHFETSSVLIRQYDPHVLTRPEGWQYAPANGGVPKAELLEVPAGAVELGKPAEPATFGWDNEYGSKTLDVPGFAAGRNLVSNQEFLEFVLDGGYGKRDLWSDEAWEWKERTGTEHPKFWVKESGGFRYRAMFDELDMPMSWPAEVNAHEALAYCRWLGEGYRLMSEGEFHRLTEGAPLEDGDCVFSEAYNLNLAYGSPTPVGMMSDGRSRLGFNDVYGNVWEWLSTDFYPLPGFETHEYYRDFSEPYFDSDHSMMLGGAWASTGTSASRFYRLWFRRNFYQHAGFRLARDSG